MLDNVFKCRTDTCKNPFKSFVFFVYIRKLDATSKDVEAIIITTASHSLNNNENKSGCTHFCLWVYFIIPRHANFR